MEKQLEIALKAGEMFMKYGIKSVSMDDLSRELGISKKTIYTHFLDKNVLVEYVLENHIGNMQNSCGTLLVDCDNAIQELYEMINFMSQKMSTIHPSVIFDLQKYHPKAWGFIEKHENEFVLPRILENINRGRQEGLYRADFDAQIVAQIYVNVNDLIFNQTIKGPSDSSLVEIFQESLRFILFGMATPEGKKYIRKHIIYEK